MSEKTLFSMPSINATRQVMLSYKGKEVTVNPEDTPFVVGRDPAEANLVVPSNFASRKHCMITHKDHSFYLEDCSTNGTYIRIGVAPPVRLQNSGTTISGSGSFKLGEAMSVGDEDVVTYKTSL